MVITTTAVAFILLSLGLAFCGWRFLRASSKVGNIKNNNKSRFLFPLFFLGFAIQNGILGFGTLLFAHNSEGLYFILLVANSFLTIVATFGVYAAYYIFSPRTSPWPLIIVTIILGITAVVFALVAHPRPFLTSQKGIDWNMPFTLSLMTFYLLLIGIGSQFYVFVRLFFQGKELEKFMKIVNL